MQNVEFVAIIPGIELQRCYFTKRKEKYKQTKKILGILMCINVSILIYCVSNIIMYIVTHAVNFSSNIIIMT